jgi:hypothetical protein
VSAYAAWIPSEHTIVLVGLAAASVLVASALVAKRDSWFTALRSHPTAVRRSVAGAAVVVVFALAVAHVDDLESLLHRVEQGDSTWLAVAVALEAISFAGYVVLTRAVYRPCAPRLDWAGATELTLAGVVATRVFSAGGCAPGTSRPSRPESRPAPLSEPVVPVRRASLALWSEDPRQ